MKTTEKKMNSDDWMKEANKQEEKRRVQRLEAFFFGTFGAILGGFEYGFLGMIFGGLLGALIGATRIS